MQRQVESEIVQLRSWKGRGIPFSDSRRYVERAVSAGVDATLDVWMGMPHRFISGVGSLNAANLALEAVGTFLSDRLEGAR